MRPSLILHHAAGSPPIDGAARRQIKLTLAPDVVAILRAMPGRASRYVDEAVRAYASIPSRRANSR